MKDIEKIKEIDNRIRKEIGKRNHNRQIYVEFMCVANAAIAATDMLLAVGKKDIITWNIADDVARRINKLEAGYRKEMNKHLLYRYCDLMAEFDSAIEKEMEAMRARCEDNAIIMGYINFYLLIEAINDNIRACSGGIVHQSRDDIEKRIDTRWKDLLKRTGLAKKTAYCVLSDEFKALRKKMKSNWHMERVYHKKIKQSN